MTSVDKPSADFWGRVFNKNHDIVTRKIAGELFLVPVRGRLVNLQRLFTLNPAGEFIWQALLSQKSLGDIRNDLVSHFSLDKELAGKDLEEFVAELMQAGLISEELPVSGQVVSQEESRL